MTENLKKELSALGADIAGGLKICMGMESLYDKLLVMFLLDSNFRRMTEAMGKNDYEGAYDYAHALKGVVLNIGFKHLADLLIAMMKNIKEKNLEQANEQLVLLTQKYTDTCKVIKNYIGQ